MIASCAAVGTSFTVDTLRELKAELPESELVFLMGADSLVEFDKWREPAEICRLANVVVVARGGDSSARFADAASVLAEWKSGRAACDNHATVRD